MDFGAIKCFLYKILVIVFHQYLYICGLSYSMTFRITTCSKDEFQFKISVLILLNFVIRPDDFVIYKLLFSYCLKKDQL